MEESDSWAYWPQACAWGFFVSHATPPILAGELEQDSLTACPLKSSFHAVFGKIPRTQIEISLIRYRYRIQSMYKPVAALLTIVVVTLQTLALSGQVPLPGIATPMVGPSRLNL